MKSLDDLREMLRNQTEAERRAMILSLQPPEMRRLLEKDGSNDPNRDPFAVPPDVFDGMETEFGGEDMTTAAVKAEGITTESVTTEDLCGAAAATQEDAARGGAGGSRIAAEVITVNRRAASVRAMDLALEAGAKVFCDEWGVPSILRPRRPQDTRDRPVLDLRNPEAGSWLAWLMYHKERKPLKKSELVEAVNLLIGEALENAQPVDAGCMVEREPVLEAILEFLQPHKTWSGTASQLLFELKATAARNNLDFGQHENWPKDATRLSQHIKRLEEWLTELGVHYERRWTRSRRLHVLSWTADWEGEADAGGRGKWEEIPERRDARDAVHRDFESISKIATLPPQKTNRNSFAQALAAQWAKEDAELTAKGSGLRGKPR